MGINTEPASENRPQTRLTSNAGIIGTGMSMRDPKTGRLVDYTASKALTQLNEQPSTRAVLGDIGNRNAQQQHPHAMTINNYRAGMKPGNAIGGGTTKVKKLEKTTISRTLTTSDQLLRESIENIKAGGLTHPSIHTAKESATIKSGGINNNNNNNNSGSTGDEYYTFEAMAKKKKMVNEMRNSNGTIRPSHVADIDVLDAEHCEFCSEYAHDVYNYLRGTEASFMVDAQYMQQQASINAKMRAVLVDWLVDVHLKFKLLQETLYLCVNIIDRFLARHPVPRDRLQLVGVTAMMIAAKYEEVYSPEINDFIYITDDAYTRREILEMEMQILNTLNFSLGAPLALHFLRRCSKAAEAEAICHTLAKYLIELTIIDIAIIRHAPSAVAASALLLAQRMLNQGEWDDTVQFYAGYNEDDLTDCMMDIFRIVSAARSSTLQATHKKYNNNRFYRVSALADAQCNNLRDDES